MRRRSVRFSSAARERLREVGHHRERRILRAVVRASASIGTRRLFHVQAGLDVAACELVDDGETVLVYAVCTGQEMLARLLGEEIFQRVSRRQANRLLHWRFY
jgi:hypothetical protein